MLLTFNETNDFNHIVAVMYDYFRIGYKGSKKSTPYAAGLAATQAAKAAIGLGLKSVKVFVNGTGQGKDTAIRSLASAGLQITELNDVTPLPHNGCHPPKKPR